jgi:hypothetical protein
MIGLQLGLKLGKSVSGGDSSPGGSANVLLLANATDGLLLADGASFLLLTV